ncbi:MAG: hypothetical protein ACAI44_28215 [Candidatus Sericytochromatia bacterium]
MDNISNSIRKIFTQMDEMFVRLIKVQRVLSLQPAVGFQSIAAGPPEAAIAFPVRVVTGRLSRPKPEKTVVPEQVPGSTGNLQPFSEQDLKDMKRLCAIQNEPRRLKLLNTYEQLLAGIRLLQPDPKVRALLEADLLQQLLLELNDTVG